MQIARAGDLPLSSDYEQIGELLPLEGARLLELGCGAALTTSRLVESFPVREIVATEVDRVQHEKNLRLTDLPNVRFQFGGAQDIALPDHSVDAVIMLKSLHHVPLGDMDTVFFEIARVLSPGGLAYISEPVYAGEFNEILRLFNDEKVAREAAFESIRRVVDSGRLRLEKEVHFRSITRFQGFSEFERRILGATHSNFDVDAALHARVREEFMPHVGDNGVAEFLSPLRVDLLRKPG